MNRVLISGIGGFVGRNLSNYLRETGSEVQGLGRTEGANQISWDALEERFPLCDAVIHLAGKAHDLKNAANPQEYYAVNTGLTKKLFDKFLSSEATVFIFLSSVKAAADEVQGVLDEAVSPNPVTDYGKSKLQAEEYIQNQLMPAGKKVYILRPCMIHGPGNKGNLNLLYKVISKGIPWPLSAFNNQRSFCSIDNLNFVIRELLEHPGIPSGVYNVADDEPLPTNTLVELIAAAQGRKARTWSIPKAVVRAVAGIGGLLKLPLNRERLQKLTENYVVSNAKLKKALGKPLPQTAKEGLMKTLESFKKDVQ
jgi:nucleoside-diphosphate-sugar epimerase